MKNKILHLYSDFKTFAIILLVVGFFSIAPKVFAFQGTQFYAEIEDQDSPIYLEPITVPSGTGLYRCDSYPTNNDQEHCNSSYDWTSYTSGSSIEITGATTNGTYYINIFSGAGGRSFDSGLILGYYEFTYLDGVWSTPAFSTQTRFIDIVPQEPFTKVATTVVDDYTFEVYDTSDIYVGQRFTSSHLNGTDTYVASITDSTHFEASNTSSYTGSDDVLTFSSTIPNNEDVGAYVFINSDDFIDNKTKVKVRFSSVGNNEIGGDIINAVDGYYTKIYDVEDTDLDTVVAFFENKDLPDGIALADFYIYNESGSIWSDIVNFLFLPSNGLLPSSYDILAEKHLYFTVNQNSGFDDFFSNARITYGGEESIIGTIVENGVNGIFDKCRIFDDSFPYFNFDFDFGACLTYLFIPSKPALINEWTTFKDNVLSVFPLGYITRFVSILTDTSAVEPPALTYTFGSSVGSGNPSGSVDTGLEGSSVSYQIWDKFDVLESIESDQGDNKNIWDIIMPWFNIAVVLAVFLVMLNDILSIQIFVDSTQSISTSDSFDTDGNDTRTSDIHRETSTTFKYQGISSTRVRSRDTSHVQIFNRRSGKDYNKITNRSRRRNGSKGKFF